MKFHPLADLFPLMQGAEFERFADDVEANGLHEAILVHQDGSIIDGRNRFRACEARHLEPRFRTYDGTDGEVLDFVLSANLVRRHLNESQRAVVAAKMATFGHGGDRSKTQICAMTQADAAEKLNVGRRSVQSAVVVLDKGTQGLIAAVETGGIAVSDASSIVDRPRADQDALLATVTGGEKKNLIAAVRAADIARQRAEIAAGNFTLPEGVFDCIVIDPPWPYGTQEQYDPVGFRVTTPYPEMGLDELAAIEIPAAEDCVLWLWTTHRFMPDVV